MKHQYDTRQSEIKSLFENYCNQHLNKAYLEVITNIFDDLIEQDEDVFKRGDVAIWAAAIVWAAGSTNFLGDKTFEPYATLSDVCSFFGVNNSTTGQKAGKIRAWLDIDQFGEDYMIEGSPVASLLNSYILNEEGFIVPASWLEDSEEEDEDEEEEDAEEEYDQESEMPLHYTIVVQSRSKYDQSDLYQIEYLLKTVLAEDEKVISVKRNAEARIHMALYGRPYKTKLLDNKLRGTKFQVIDLLSKIDDD